jgi:hypothetical protein
MLENRDCSNLNNSNLNYSNLNNRPENDQAPRLQRRVPLHVSLGSGRARDDCRRFAKL